MNITYGFLLSQVSFRFKAGRVLPMGVINIDGVGIDDDIRLHIVSMSQAHCQKNTR